MAEIYYILLYYLYAVSLLNIKEIRKLTTPTPWPTPWPTPYFVLTPKFELKPSILNRVVPQVLLHNLTK